MITMPIFTTLAYTGCRMQRLQAAEWVNMSKLPV